MTELKIQMEMERVDLLAKIEAFNKKAEIVGVDPISGVSGNVNSITAVTDASRVEGKVFNHHSYAEEYLQKMGWERVSAYSDEFMKDRFIATVKSNPNGNGWIIVTM